MFNSDWTETSREKLNPPCNTSEIKFSSLLVQHLNPDLKPHICGAGGLQCNLQSFGTIMFLVKPKPEYTDYSSTATVLDAAEVLSE